MKDKKSMDMLRLYVKVFACFILPFVGHAQQVQMNTPFLLNRTLINPSYSGALEFHQFDFFMGTKSKWNGVPGAPVVNASHALARFTKKHSGGIQFVENAYATHNYKSFAIPYSFTAKLNDSHAIMLGLVPRFTQSSIDFSNATTELTVEPARSNYSRIGVSMDATAGISYHFKRKLSVGVAMANFLTRGNVRLANLPNYTSFSLLQGVFDAHYLAWKSENHTIKLDVLATTNGALPVTYESYVSNTMSVKDNSLLFGVGYKSTGDAVFIVRALMPKFYYLYTLDIPILGQQITPFTGNYFGFGYRFTAPSKRSTMTNKLII